VRVFAPEEINMSAKVHRIAIIGVGAISEIIARGLVELPQAKLIAGSCRTREKGEKFAQKFDCAYYEDFERMLDTERPDVAIVCTPSGSHLDGVLACAQRKIDVLCEKPLEITTARVSQMTEAAERAGIVLGGIFPLRFNGVIRAMRDAIAQGRLGNLSVIAAAVPWWRDDSYYGKGRWQGTAKLDGGGAMINQSIHCVDLIQWMAASTMPNLSPDQNPVEEVFAFTGKRGHDASLIEVEDTAVAVMRFRNGAFGQLLAATSMYPGSFRRLHAAGRDGTIEIVEDELRTFSFREKRADDDATIERFRAQTTHGGGASNPMAIPYIPHRENVADFLAAREQRRPPALSAREAGKAVAIIESCYESARTGKAVRPG
jgi:UDP-N-acetyl-2-amino-2-deoxyglucuronate dehydrogenase